MNTIWTVHIGCKYEGGSVKFIASSKEKAFYWVKHWIKHQHKVWRGRYKYSESRIDDMNYSEPAKWSATWCAIEGDCYAFGENSDIMYVRERRVY